MKTRQETLEWQRLDSAHYLHPFTDYKALSARGARIEREQAIAFPERGRALAQLTR